MNNFIDVTKFQNSLHKKVVLDRINFGFSTRYSKCFLQDLKYDQAVDVVADEIIHQVRYSLFGKKDTQYITFPSSAWQHVKESFYNHLPWKIHNFFKKKFPVKYTKYNVERVLVFPEIPPVPYGEPSVTFNIMKEDVKVGHERY